MKNKKLNKGTNSQYGGFYAQCNGANTNAASNFSLFEGRNGSTVTFDVRADGSATFAGGIDVATRSTFANGVVVIANDGGVNVKNISQSDNNWTIQTDGSAEFKNKVTVSSDINPLEITRNAAAANNTLVARFNNNSARVIDLFTDGSALFAGGGKFVNTVTSGSNDYTGPYTYISSGGMGVMANSSTPMAAVNADGSAEFAGGVESRQGILADQRMFAAADMPPSGSSVGLSVGQNNSALIYADGSAQFAGGDINLTADGDISFTPPAGVAGVQSRLIWTTEAPFLDEVASIEASRAADANAATSLTFNTGGGTAGSLKQALSLNADGSAEFAGIVGIGNYTSDEGNTNYVRIYDGGGIRINRSSGTNAESFTIYDGPASDASNKRIILSSDGSATFSSVGSTSVLFGNLTNGGTCTRINSSGIFGETFGVTSNLPAQFPYGTSGASGRNLEVFGGLQINSEPDNPANYTTTTDAEGNETQVYNGPTLDVKERLTRTSAALTALKAAASDNSTTLADLKSAFVAALADF